MLGHFFNFIVPNLSTQYTININFVVADMYMNIYFTIKYTNCQMCFHKLYHSKGFASSQTITILLIDGSTFMEYKDICFQLANVNRNLVHLTRWAALISQEMMDVFFGSQLFSPINICSNYFKVTLF